LKDWPPLLKAMQIEANGHLRLTINEAWLPKKGHRLVPWPPPRTSGGHIVLALYVFLHGTNDEGHYTDIALEGLYRLIGITDPKAAHAKRRLLYALDCINQYLTERRGALYQAQLAESFTAKFEGERVSFTAINRAAQEWQDAEERWHEAEQQGDEAAELNRKEEHARLLKANLMEDLSEAAEAPDDELLDQRDRQVTERARRELKQQDLYEFGAAMRRAFGVNHD
jgi:hypothetical protein